MTKIWDFLFTCIFIVISLGIPALLIYGACIDPCIQKPFEKMKIECPAACQVTVHPKICGNECKCP